MIPRYTRPEMAAIWSPETKFRIWFEIEAHACDAQAELGVIPEDAAKTVWDGGGRVRRGAHRRDRARNQARRHRLPDQSGRNRRPGSALRAPGHDLVGRARHLPGVQLVRAADLLLADLDALLAALKRRAFEHKDTSASAAATASTPSPPPSG
jgi:adenylosuccinate lyase